jgi:hypothetical protein
MIKTQWLLLALILPFVKGCVFPGWSSALELLFCCLLVGFLSYFKPKSPLEAAQVREIEQLRESVAALKEQFTGLKLKLGLRPER